jgi:hypothetical protein
MGLFVDLRIWRNIPDRDLKAIYIYIYMFVWPGNGKRKTPQLFRSGVFDIISFANYASATLLKPVTIKPASTDLMYSLTLSLLSLI